MIGAAVVRVGKHFVGDFFEVGSLQAVHEPVFLVTLFGVKVYLIAKHHQVVLFELLHPRF